MPQVSIEAIHGAVAGTTAPQLFLKLASERPDLPALHSMRPDAPGSWNVWTLKQYADATARAVAGLQRAGLGRGFRYDVSARHCHAPVSAATNGSC